MKQSEATMRGKAITIMYAIQHIPSKLWFTHRRNPVDAFGPIPRLYRTFEEAKDKADMLCRKKGKSRFDSVPEEDLDIIPVEIVPTI